MQNSKDYIYETPKASFSFETCSILQSSKNIGSKLNMQGNHIIQDFQMIDYELCL